MDYGPGIGAVSSNGGVLICGGEKNVMNGPLDNLGGKVNKHTPSDTFLSSEYSKNVSLIIFWEYSLTNYVFSTKTIRLI